MPTNNGTTAPKPVGLLIC